MEDVIFKIKVVEAAKAHVGKTIDVRVKQRGALHYNEQLKDALLSGECTYKGNEYAVRLFESPHYVAAYLDAWPVRSKLTFTKIEIL